MLDRASTFADETIVELLKEKYVPVAIDQRAQRRQKDAEGDFYRKIAGQGPRGDFQRTTQGLYVADAAGKLFGYNNNRGPERIRALLEKTLAEFQPPRVDPIEESSTEARFDPKPPEGGLVVRVHAKILGGYASPKDEWEKIFHSAVARDNLWITREEQDALAGGKMPKALAERIARFHLVDNTRGEPPMWEKDEIRQLDLKLNDGKLSGHVELRTASGGRGFIADVEGIVASQDGRVTQFDCVAKGKFWGEGQYTPGAPSGKFPLVVTFRLADGRDLADAIPPEAALFWIDGYFHPQ